LKVQYLLPRDGLQLIKSASETEALAKSLDYDHGVYLVPAFAGLGAPYWDPDARGAIYGLTRGSSAAHLSRATLESVCYQTNDLLKAMSDDGVQPQKIRVDGGMVNNNWLCQFLSDVLDIEVERPQILETTALGAAYLAGLQAGIYTSLADLAHSNKIDSHFSATMDPSLRLSLLSGWHKAVQCTLKFGQ
jgi:glycerol kinase